MSYKNKRKGSTVKRYQAPRKKNPAPLKRQKQAATVALANMRTGGYLGTELKFYDTQGYLVLSDDIDSSAVVPIKADDDVYATATPTVNALFAPAIGSGQNQRDGRVCTLTSLYSTLDLRLTIPEPLVNAHANIRCFTALVLDTQSNGAVGTPSEVWRHFTGFDIDTINPLRSLENIQRFRVLDHKMVNLPVVPSGVLTGQGQYGLASAKDVILQKRFPNGLKVHFKGDGLPATSRSSDISDNNIFMVAWVADAAFVAAAGHSVSLTAKTRCRFRG